MERTPGDSPDLPRRLNMYGAALIRQAADPPRATATLRRACESALVIDPQTALFSARLWGWWAENRQVWPEAAEAYGFGLAAMRTLVRVQLVRTEKENWLRETAGLGTEAAYAHTAAGSPHEAVVALEQSRAALLDEALQRERADLDQLRGTQWEPLIDRYVQAAVRERDLQALPVSEMPVVARPHTVG
ncbi:hypothetical protein OHA21_21195 [Actinoplanes sp. NBC_00393]|uniref:hypothetical protein n=1 Tax=Actinoplanes sp. NBC_00393 TaxID=2975953 RepID=UPI002E1E93DC